jgi:hypothetical protein
MSESNSHREPPGFAATDKIAAYGGISSAFFPLVGLGDVLFISNESRLSDIRDSAASGTPMDVFYARIRELYGVDVSGLDLLVDIFEQIQSGPVYQEWLKAQQ